MNCERILLHLDLSLKVLERTQMEHGSSLVIISKIDQIKLRFSIISD